MLSGSEQGKKFAAEVRSSDALAANQFEEQYGRICAALGTTSEAEIGRKIGRAQSTVWAAVQNKSIPKSWLSILKKKYGISIGWILEGTKPQKVAQSESPFASVYSPPPGGAAHASLESEQFLMIPLLESRVTGGLEGELLYDDISDYLPFKRDWIERLVGRNPERQRALILVRVRGDSMSPTINQGEVTLVDTFEYERLQVLNGRIYLVIHPDGTVAMKRLVLIQEADRVKLLCLSDNTPDYRPFEFDLDPGKTLKHYILGRVRWCGKEFD